MLTLRLPDGSSRQVPESSTPRQIAESIGKRLAQAAIAAKVNGHIVDLDCEFSDAAQKRPTGLKKSATRYVRHSSKKSPSCWLSVTRNSQRAPSRFAIVSTAILEPWAFPI